ncbi:MAG TPA: hypothetical protein VFP33_08605 [Gallionella sp.]|nr:hypothetical protein [Gallionella sp.]
MNIRQSTGGILIRVENAADIAEARRKFFEHAADYGIDQVVEDIEDGRGARFRLKPALQHQWAPDCNTLQLCEKVGLAPLSNPSDLEKEILLAMLLGPAEFEYPSHDELVASIRVRCNIAEAARRTALAFHTSKIERPTDYWTYAEERGFTVLPGKPLIEALRKATQPEVSGQHYSFSCYRATEYVMLLGIAQELATRNPALLQQLQRQWESRAIMSRQYHDVFLREYGSMDEPLPPGYYVPGERLWFRNPDERSSDVSGYEGSWVVYMGGGLFTNFWNCDKPYTMAAKCVEVYHWRDGVYQDDEGNLQMDESVVEERVRATLGSPAEVERILARMMRLRDPQGVYADGGCIDTSREYARWICPGTADLVLPEN